MAFRAKYYRTAAKDLKHGYNANRSTAAVWTGVSVACAAACGKVAGGAVCNISSIGGSVGEGVITKKFSDALMSEGMKFGSDTMAKKSADNDDRCRRRSDYGRVQFGGGKVNSDACTTAGTSALKAYGKYANSKENEKSIKQIKDDTKGMNTPIAENSVSFSGDRLPPRPPLPPRWLRRAKSARMVRSRPRSARFVVPRV